MMPDSFSDSAANVSEPKRRFRLNSFGVRLFSVIMGGAILSITGVTFLFSETVKLQAEEQIQKIIESKVGSTREVTDRAEALANSLSISVATLHVRKAETPETYKELTRKLFQEHPDYIVGLGFGQKEYGILPSQQWFYPYYQAQRTSPNEARSASVLVQTEGAQETKKETQAAPTSNTRYINRALEPYFYPETEAYRTYFLPQKELWTSPYSNSEDVSTENPSLLLTYYSQIFDNENNWIGTAVVDVDSAYLSEIIDEPIYRGQGRLVLAAENGDIIANPANANSIEGQTYVDVPGLTEIWSKINAEANTQAVGLIEGESGYWSYSRVPEQSWLIVAYVPYRAVFKEIVLTALTAVLPAGLLMAGLTALVVRYLNQRLRPVINECQRLSSASGFTNTQVKGRDELEQLSTSFFSMLEQLKLNLNQPHRTAQQPYPPLAPGQMIELLPPEISPLEVDRQLSPQKLQRELVRLNEAVSSLAKDSRLSEVTLKPSDPQGLETSLSSSARAEIASIQDRLNQIFPQVLATLNQFSHLLSAFNQTQNCTMLIQETMLNANRDVEMQASVVNQLQQCAIRFRPLAEDGHRTKNGTKSQEGELTTHPAFNALQSTSKQIGEQIGALSEAAEDNHRKAKEYQRIASTAQVLIINASTLAISASRPQNPETHAEIVTQLRQKETALKALAEHLETAQLEQQSSASVKAIALKLKAVVGTLDQDMQQLDHAMQSVLNEYSRRYGEEVQRISSKSGPESSDSQSLIQQIKHLRQNLQQMKMLTDDMSEHISSTLQQTQQISSIKANVSLAIELGEV